MSQFLKNLFPAGRCRAVRNATVATVVAFAGTVPCVQAGDQAENSIFSLRGFGTFGVVRSSEKNADFVSGFFEPNGVGYTRGLGFGPDTKLGLQVDARISDKFSAVLQVVSKHQYDNSYEPKIEWANLKYQLTPDFDVRVGRTVTMPFMVSDSRLVGYGNVWVRPPQEVYGLIPITNKDGIDATYRMRFGEVGNSVHASYGETSPNLPNSGAVKAKGYATISNTLEYGAATFRASYSSGRVDLHTTGLDSFINGLTQFGNTATAFGFATSGAQALALANKYRIDNARISFLSLGAGYDRDQWLLMTEWAKFNGHSLLADSTAWYATAGYRIREFTPYLTVARLRADYQLEAGISTAGLPGPLATSAATLNAGLNAGIISSAFAQRSIALGVRWDFRKNAALKVQYDHIWLDPGSGGRLGNLQPAFQPGGKVNVFGVAVDFVF